MPLEGLLLVSLKTFIFILLLGYRDGRSWLHLSFLYLSECILLTSLILSFLLLQTPSLRRGVGLEGAVSKLGERVVSEDCLDELRGIVRRGVSSLWKCDEVKRC